MNNIWILLDLLILLMFVKGNVEYNSVVVVKILILIHVPTLTSYVCQHLRISALAFGVA